MRAEYSPYEPVTLPNCCGVPDIGGWMANNAIHRAWMDAEDCPKIKDLRVYGCGIFVATFLPSQRSAMRECSQHHTLLFKTGPHKNKSSSASNEGREKGVYLCVFKFGKEK